MKAKVLFAAATIVVCSAGEAARCVGQGPTGPATLENLLDPPVRQPPPSPDRVDRPARLPVPADEAIKEARDLIHQAYETDYATAGGNPEPLIQKLLAAASKTDLPARAYAGLLEAEAVAMKAGNCDRVLELVDIRAGQFDMDVIQCRIDRLSDLLTQEARRDPTLLAKLCDHALDTAKRALIAESFASGKAAADLAAGMAKTLQLLCRSKRLPEQIAAADGRLRAALDLLKSNQQRRETLEAVKKAEASLATNPDDPVANSTVGKYRCFVRGDWERGLPLLAKADSAALAKLATDEIALRRDDEPDQTRLFAIAGRWWTLADDADGGAEEQAAMHKHAGALYAVVVDRLVDPIDVQVAKSRLGKTGATKEEARIGEVSRSDAGNATTPPHAGSSPLDPAPGSSDGEGGTARAIATGLAWLAAHQLPDGGWSFEHGLSRSCNGQCGDAGRNAEDRAAATALALIAFHRHGKSHKEGAYKAELRQGVAFLANLAASGGGKCYGKGASMYSQGCAALALAEAYALTKDTRLRPAAQATLNFIQAAQDPEGGGWRYEPGQRGDTSATGWQVAALTTGKAAGLAVRPEVLAGADRFLNSVQSDGGAAYGYTDPGKGRGTTAVGLYSRCRLGWPAKSPALNRGAAELAQLGPSSDLYFDYYATQVLRHVGGDAWTGWRNALQEKLLETQQKQDHTAGSWHDGMASGHGPSIGGRLYCTSLALMILATF